MRGASFSYSAPLAARRGGRTYLDLDSIIRSCISGSACISYVKRESVERFGVKVAVDEVTRQIRRSPGCQGRALGQPEIENIGDRRRLEVEVELGD